MALEVASVKSTEPELIETQVEEISFKDDFASIGASIEENNDNAEAELEASPY